jgi:putative effector of murein hydrolase LrgA (UPF0299 family)
METITQIYEQTSAPFLAVIIGVTLLVWFAPAIVAVFLNPKHAKLIAIACVPAGLSIIAWSAVMVWAVTGKVVDKYKGKITENKEEPAPISK